MSYGESEMKGRAKMTGLHIFYLACSTTSSHRHLKGAIDFRYRIGGTWYLVKCALSKFSSDAVPFSICIHGF